MKREKSSEESGKEHLQALEEEQGNTREAIAPIVTEILTVGTELLMGNIVNTNASYLSERCTALGLSVYRETTVGDNAQRLEEVLKAALSRSDVVILTGGLGPTPDDLTKEVTAQVLGLPLMEDARTRERIASYLGKTPDRKVTENNWKQALIPEGAAVLDNDNGTAPGLALQTEEGKSVFLLPGPPDELYPMFEEKVAPLLASLTPYRLYTEMVKLCGVGESAVADKIADLIAGQSNPTIATYAKVGTVDVRITARAKSPKEAQKLLKPVMDQMTERFGRDIYSMDEDSSLEDVVVSVLKKKNCTISLAESCTGGLLAGRLVNVPGASKVLKLSFVTYSNEAKNRLLGVKKSTLKEFGAVSRETAREMAKGVCKVTKADIGVAITGIAGPDGGSKKKPVGLVYIACNYKKKVTVCEYHFSGNRAKVREQSVISAMDLARRCLQGE